MALCIHVSFQMTQVLSMVDGMKDTSIHSVYHQVLLLRKHLSFSVLPYAAVSRYSFDHRIDQSKPASSENMNFFQMLSDLYRITLRKVRRYLRFIPPRSVDFKGPTTKAFRIQGICDYPLTIMDSSCCKYHIN